MKITSNFAILDVKDGREELAEHFMDNPGARIPITIIGYINYERADGTFSIEVEHISLTPADVKFTVHSSMGHNPNPTFTTEAEARKHNVIQSYIRKGTSFMADISRTITVSEVLK